MNQMLEGLKKISGESLAIRWQNFVSPREYVYSLQLPMLSRCHLTGKKPNPLQ